MPALLIGLAMSASALASPPSDGSSTRTEPPPPRQIVSAGIAVAPGIGWNASPDDAVHGTSLGLLTHHHSVRGLQLALASWADHGVRGAQASSLVAVSGGLSTGFQGAGLVTVAEHQRGLQGAGVFAMADTLEGVQASAIAALARDVEGLQATAFLGVADELRGVQATGGVNLARELTGTQLGLLNIGRCVQGAQVGLVNIGGHVRGAQLGLLNVARRVDGTSVGALSLIGNGLHEVDIWTSESATTIADVKVGGRHVYTLVGAGLLQPRSDGWTLGVGWGVHIPVGRAWLEADASAWGLARGSAVVPGVHGKLRASAGVQLHDHVAPFVGLSLNGWLGDGSVMPRADGGPGVWSRSGAATWPGLHAGVQF